MTAAVEFWIGAAGFCIGLGFIKRAFDHAVTGVSTGFKDAALGLAVGIVGCALLAFAASPFI